MCKWLTTEERDPFNLTFFPRLQNPGNSFVERFGLSAFEGQELRVAAAGTTERAALKPDGKPSPGAFGLRARDHLGNLHRLHQWFGFERGKHHHPRVADSSGIIAARRAARCRD